jgi:prophage DNA circulation protein
MGDTSIKMQADSGFRGVPVEPTHLARRVVRNSSPHHSMVIINDNGDYIHLMGFNGILMGFNGMFHGILSHLMGYTIW